jgi:N-dimethylarginine dimethylaminohydrolase
MNDFGSQNMIGALKRVIVSPPNEKMGTASPDFWHYLGPIDYAKAVEEHAAFVALLERHGAEVISMPPPAGSGLMDLMFAHDASVVTRHGVVLMRMGKIPRRGEEAVHRALYERLGIPILGQITEPGTMESGDFLWLREDLLAVGLGTRTNEEGVRQLRTLFDPLGIEVRTFDLSTYRGPKACMHIMTTASLLREDLALVVRPLLPPGLGQLLAELGFDQIEAPMDEFEESNGISSNILALAPNRCVMVDGFPKTKATIAGRGCRIETYSGEEICVKAEGGPTCLTRPLLRLWPPGSAE